MVNEIQTPICEIMFAMNDVSMKKRKRKRKKIHTLYEFTKCWL